MPTVFEGSRDGLANVPVEETKRLIEQAAAVVPAVIFMGAEPTLNPNLPELIRFAVELGLKADVSTNALRLARWEYLNELHGAGLNTIELSWPYPDATVYSRITGARPRGFQRLLGALDNIDRLNSGLRPEGRHFVRANVVVSRFNVDRLDETLSHLAARLKSTDYLVTIKGVQKPRELDLELFRDTVYVPCGRLRRRLPPVCSRLAPGPAFELRALPLCAAPGFEQLNADLRNLLDGARIEQNFEDQSRMASMYAENELRGSHRFDSICETCNLDSICSHRELFRHAGAGDDDKPVPLLTAVPKDLAAWVRGRAGREDHLARAPRSKPRSTAKHDDWPPRIEQPTLLSELEPAARCALPPAWGELVGGPFRERLEAMVATQNALAGRLEGVDEVSLRLVDASKTPLGSVALLPRDGRSTQGFLCGPARLAFAWHGALSSQPSWIRAACRACLSIDVDRQESEALRFGDVTFLDQLWRTLGTALLPRAHAAFSVVDGQVSDDEVRLSLRTAEGQPVEIVFLPRHTMTDPYAVAGTIGLRYDTSGAVADDVGLRKIVEVYARRLTAGAR